MSKRYAGPSFLLLQTVEAVTRLSSFKRAADELCVTPSAVSHRIKQIEEQLGRPFFNRSGNETVPTSTAYRIATVVAAANEMMAAEWGEIVRETQGVPTRVRCMALFAEHFILDHLSEVDKAFPSLSIHSTTKDLGEEAAPGPFDIMIGIGQHPGENWDYEDILPFRVKAVYRQRPAEPIVTEQGITGPLLGNSPGYIPWDEVSRRLQLPILPRAKTVPFDSIAAALASAVAGHGIALAPEWMIAGLTRNHGMTVVDGPPIDTGLSYWFAVRKQLKYDTVSKRFKRWILRRITEALGTEIPSSEAPKQLAV